jgi:hypothetical protein
MACLITDGIALDCLDAMGGVKAAWILGGTVSGYTINGTDQLSGLTGTGTYFKFELPKDTASFVETVTVAPANGTVYYSQALTMQFHKMDSTKRNQIKLLAKNRALQVCFLDANDLYWYMGLTRGAQVTSASANTGTAVGDANNYIMTLTSDEPAPVYGLSGSLASIITGGLTAE